MEKENPLLPLRKLWRIMLLAIWVSACNGQKKNEDLQRVNTEIASDTTQTAGQNMQGAYWGVDYSEQISQVVRMMFQDSKGHLWFGAQNGAHRLEGDSLLRIEGIESEFGQRVTIKDITEGPDGKIWFGHSDGISSLEGETVVNYYESDGLISNDVWNIEVDAEGTLWIGTIEGVCTFDGQTFTKFELPEGQIDSTLGVSSTKMVHCILADSKGAIWFCTNAGLFQFADNTLVNVSKRVGIQTNFVNEIIERPSGAYWISTKKALYRLKGDDLENITRDIPDLGKGIGSIAEDKEGTLWFVFNQHFLYTYEGDKITEFQKSEENPGPVVYKIFKDEAGRLWFVGFGGAYRLEEGEFVNVTKEGPW